jgi:hypothetical protein
MKHSLKVDWVQLNRSFSLWRSQERINPADGAAHLNGCAPTAKESSLKPK